jgi:hypothetical protein
MREDYSMWIFHHHIYWSHRWLQFDHVYKRLISLDNTLLKLNRWLVNHLFDFEHSIDILLLSIRDLHIKCYNINVCIIVILIMDRSIFSSKTQSIVRRSNWVNLTSIMECLLLLKSMTIMIIRGRMFIVKYCVPSANARPYFLFFFFLLFFQVESPWAIDQF